MVMYMPIPFQNLFLVIYLVLSTTLVLPVLWCHLISHSAEPEETYEALPDET